MSILKFFLLNLFLLSGLLIFGQTDTIKNNSNNINDSIKAHGNIKKDKIKKGFNFGGLPIIAYDSDLGFKYGIALNIYNYGNGTIYPEYLYYFYLEWSRTTLGYSCYDVFFDSEKLLPKNLRVTADVQYIKEKALDYFGFNGYNSLFNEAFEDKNNPEYITRLFYDIDRRLWRSNIDFQGNIYKNKLKWICGLGYYGIKTGRCNFDDLNKNKSEEKKIKDTTTYYDMLVGWNIISQYEADGGNTYFTKFGIILDTRDNEPNPMKGLWSELTFLAAPKIFDAKNGYLQMQIIHRQYVTLVKDRLSFSYRLGYQTKLLGQIPFYMLPFVFNSYYTNDGLGGAKTLRGIRLNRVVGEGISYFNTELRWKFAKFNFIKQNFYLTLSSFFDAGITTLKYKFNESNISDYEKSFVDCSPEQPHGSYGLGLYIVMNQNMVIRFNYGFAIDKRDGDNGLYIGFNFLY